jgi:hypothetical protein
MDFGAPGYLPTNQRKYCGHDGRNRDNEGLMSRKTKKANPLVRERGPQSTRVSSIQSIIFDGLAVAICRQRQQNRS